ncbi:hypothetical protein [Filomicrobium insigne]|uniref:hypothetical protein n=1 Tax=Filomicrobium insigne TaxID=418854 RepID=UPI0011136EB5|nr:hypothetical protein [Filomicrobium insigne]
MRRTKLRILDPQHIRNLDILDAAEAAAYLRTSRTTLANYGCYWGGPSFEGGGTLLSGLRTELVRVLLCAPPAPD